MIDGLGPYPEYRDSGVEWLGEIPERWLAVRLKQVAAVQTGITLGKHYGDASLVERPYLRVANVQAGRLSLSKVTTVRVPPSEAAGSTLQFGDVLMTEGGDIDKLGRGCVWRSEIPGCLHQNHIFAVRPRDRALLPEFLVAFMGSPNGRSYFQTTAKQTTNLAATNSTTLGNFPLRLPTLGEQSAIVRFLDYADRRIRRYIRAKQKLIELLEEQKQAIIHRAVTRGLDPNVRLKPSGVEWLDGVPDHWQVWQVGHFASVGNGCTPSRSNAAYWAGGTYPWLNSSSVNAGTITRANQNVTEVALRECHLPRVPAGSVLVAITGQGKTRGTAATLEIEATINQHLAYITPRITGRWATPDYLRACLVAAYAELRRISDDSGSTKGALTCADLRHFRVALPPRDEQLPIVRCLLETTATVRATLDRAEREIAFLREYRTRLVADVVTGKLDVREAAARLPDEGEESEPLDEAETWSGAEEDGAEDLEAASEEAEV